MILCSKVCAEKEITPEVDIVKELQTIIIDLRDELAQQSEFIKRLQKRSVSYQEEVCDIESNYISKIEAQEALINQLQKRPSYKILTDVASQTESTELVEFETQFNADNYRGVNMDTQTPLVTTIDNYTQSVQC